MSDRHEQGDQQNVNSVGSTGQPKAKYVPPHMRGKAAEPVAPVQQQRNQPSQNASFGNAAPRSLFRDSSQSRIEHHSPLQQARPDPSASNVSPGQVMNEQRPKGWGGPAAGDNFEQRGQGGYNNFPGGNRPNSRAGGFGDKGFGGGERKQWSENGPSSGYDRQGGQGGYNNNGNVSFGASDVRNDRWKTGNDAAGPYPAGGGKGRKHRILKRDPKMELELFGEKKTGINFKKYEDIPVEASGKDVPKPITIFSDANFETLVNENLELCGYEVPTPIQKWSIPIAMAGRDLMACAQTGSGKTAAFLLPILANLLSFELPDAPEGYRRKSYPHALILAPTRELATQIFQEAQKFTYRTTIRPVVIYGGQTVKDQVRELDRGCDVIVCTPGRLVDFIDRGKVSLKNIRFLVFDEADRMLDMGFEPQIRDIVEGKDMPADSRQTLMFSATFPKEIQRLAGDFLQDYVFLAVGRVGSSTDLITQKVQFCQDNDRDKRALLQSILPKCEGLTLIFVETKRGADNLENWLMDIGIEATSIHGDRTQQEREHALSMFKKGRCPVLVATDVAARGLDIPDVRHVINYDMPSNIDDYVHRIGRTGRCGATGTAIGFMTDKNRNIGKELYEMMVENKQEVPSWLEQMSKGGGYYSGGGRGGGRPAAGGKSGFGSRDYRGDAAGGSFRSNAGIPAAPAQAASRPASQAGGARPASSAFGAPSKGGAYGGFGSSKGGAYGANDAW